jgi:hypothetical protein
VGFYASVINFSIVAKGNLISWVEMVLWVVVDYSAELKFKFCCLGSFGDTSK